MDDLKAKGFHKVPLTFASINPKSKTCQHYSPSCLSFKELAYLMPKIWQTTLQKGFKIGIHLLRYSGACEYITNFAFAIDPFGDVYKCLDIIGQKEHSIGAINEEGEVPHLRYPYYDWMSRDPTLINECMNCELLPECRGGCVAIAYRRYGTYHAPGCGYDRDFMRTLKVFLINQMCETIQQNLSSISSGGNL